MESHFLRSNKHNNPQTIEEEDKSTSSGGFEGRLLTNIELIKKAEECVDQLKLEKAVSLYDEGLRRWPNDTLIID